MEKAVQLRVEVVLRGALLGNHAGQGVMNPEDGAMHTLEELRTMAATLPIGTTSHVVNGAEMIRPG